MTVQREVSDELASLTAELGSMDAEIAAARAAGDADRWMRLTFRAEELPALIAAVRKRVAASLLAPAWAHVDACRTEELRCVEVAAAALAEHRRLTESERLPLGADPLDAARVTVERETRRARVAALDRDAKQARHNTVLALFEVDRLEADSDVVPTDGDGLRAAPRPILRTLSLSAAMFDLVGEPVDEMLVTHAPGWTPPRWVAYQLNAGWFEPPDPKPVRPFGTSRGFRVVLGVGGVDQIEEGSDRADLG